MKNELFMKPLLTILIFIILSTSCTSERIKPDTNWIKTTDLTLINDIMQNNDKLKSFKARFYMTENIKRMALSGNILFERVNNNFSLTLRDVLVSSDILTMKKYKNNLLLYFHRDNKKYIENANTVRLSDFSFAIELDELIKFISLEIPILPTDLVYEQAKNELLIYKIVKDNREQTVFINKNTKKVEQIDYKKNGNDYSIQYSSYETFANFYYPETVKILNYTQKQRVLIKVEKIQFVDKLSDNNFTF